MTYKKLILASGALAATTTAVRVTDIGDTAEELFNEFFEVTGVPYVDMVLAPWQIFTPGIPNLDFGAYFRGEKGIIPMPDGVSQIERNAIATQNMVLSGYEPYIAIVESFSRQGKDWWTLETKEKPPVEFKDWWANYETFSSDQLPLDYMDEIPDREAWDEQMLSTQVGDNFHYEWVEEWLGDETYRPYKYFFYTKRNQHRAFMNEIEAQCQEYQPVGAPTPRYDYPFKILGTEYKNTNPKFTDTHIFNENMNRQSSVVLSMLYRLLGKVDGPLINERDCEAVDCLHPCYGEDQLGACQKCLQIMGKEGKRDQICDLCEVPQAPEGYLLPREI